MNGFGTRLAEAMSERGPLCVGIDPHASLLAAWGLPDDASGVREFGLRAVAALAPAVAALKPQAAFFERHGAAGLAALEDVLAAARDAGVLIILDAKRGDIGSTMSGYAQAYFSPRSRLRADALTVSPYLGPESLAPAIDTALEASCGLFVLALTSNPGASRVQHAVTSGGRSVAGVITDLVAEANRREGAPGLGSVGLVIGATTGDAARDLGLDLAASRAPILAPGLGAQGAGPADLATVFAGARDQVLGAASRSVLAAGPDGESMRAAARSLAGELQSALA